MKRVRGFIDMRGAFLGLLMIGFLLGLVAFVVVPWLWRLLKPWIHQVTQ